ncbi:MAG: chromosome condensation protein CrcB [Synechococcus sp. Baikal-G1]|nr:MAG: chromosome condensation protein CrcB [Synechococcus sp. Baikal-G1]
MALADGVLVATGAVPGAWLRFVLVNRVQPLLPRRHWATASVNLVACLALGLLLSLGDGCSDLHRLEKLLVVGFLGSFSTFSTFVVELLQALGEGQAGEALGLAGLSVGGGLLALELGRWLGGL